MPTDRSIDPGFEPAPRPRAGIRSAFAALAALILSITAVASNPESRLAACASVQVSMVGDFARTAASPAVTSAEPGSVAPRARAVIGSEHAALAPRVAVMLRHVALPPPGC